MKNKASLIGIYGKANSGKDLLGNIILYLTEGLDKANVSYEKWDGQTLWASKPFDWKVVKFADPLKECIAIMLGCDRQTLESREFKETPLGSEWQDNSTPDDLLTPRKVLTRLGTDFGRKTLSKNIWINAVFANYRPKIEAPEGVIPDDWESKWIITDVRFPNELDRIKSVGGIMIKVHRDPIHYFKPKHGEIIWACYAGKWVKSTYLYKIESNEDGHVCKVENKGSENLIVFKFKDLLPIEAEPNNVGGPENALNDYKDFDYVIDNNSDINHLITEVRKILIKENIIQ